MIGRRSLCRPIAIRRLVVSRVVGSTKPLCQRADRYPPAPWDLLWMRYEGVLRQSAKDYAHMAENGLMMDAERWNAKQSDTARSIMDEAVAEKQEERRKVEAAAKDRLKLA